VVVYALTIKRHLEFWENSLGRLGQYLDSEGEGEEEEEEEEEEE